MVSQLQKRTSPADMARLARLSQQEVMAILNNNGVLFQRWGKHGAIHVHPEDHTRRAEVPNRDPVPSGTLGNIITRARKPRSEFEKP